jgi:hypothetical protein
MEQLLRLFYYSFMEGLSALSGITTLYLRIGLYKEIDDLIITEVP